MDHGMNDVYHQAELVRTDRQTFDEKSGWRGGAQTEITSFQQFSNGSSVGHCHFTAFEPTLSDPTSSLAMLPSNHGFCDNDSGQRDLVINGQPQIFSYEESSTISMSSPPSHFSFMEICDESMFPILPTIQVPVCMATVPCSSSPIGFRTEFVNAFPNVLLEIKMTETGAFEVQTFQFPGFNTWTEGIQAADANTTEVSEVVPKPNAVRVEARSQEPVDDPESSISIIPDSTPAKSFVEQATATEPELSARQKSRRARKLVPGYGTKWCPFCKSNAESKAFYNSHGLRNEEGVLTCPVLRNFACKRCGATGDNAHTVKHCPYKDAATAASRT